MARRSSLFLGVASRKGYAEKELKTASRPAPRPRRFTVSDSGFRGAPGAIQGLGGNADLG